MTMRLPGFVENLSSACITARNVKFDIFYGISNNRRIWDISHAKEVLGYNPVENAKEFRI